MTSSPSNSPQDDSARHNADKGDPVTGLPLVSGLDQKKILRDASVAPERRFEVARDILKERDWSNPIFLEAIKTLAVQENKEAYSDLVAVLLDRENIALRGEDGWDTIEILTATSHALVDSLKRYYRIIEDFEKFPPLSKIMLLERYPDYLAVQQKFGQKLIEMLSDGNTDLKVRAAAFSLILRGLEQKSVPLTESAKDFIVNYADLSLVKFCVEHFEDITAYKRCLSTGFVAPDAEKFLMSFSKFLTSESINYLSRVLQAGDDYQVGGRLLKHFVESSGGDTLLKSVAKIELVDNFGKHPYFIKSLFKSELKNDPQFALQWLETSKAILMDVPEAHPNKDSRDRLSALQVYLQSKDSLILPLLIGRRGEEPDFYATLNRIRTEDLDDALTKIACDTLVSFELDFGSEEELVKDERALAQTKMLWGLLSRSLRPLATEALEAELTSSFKIHRQLAALILADDILQEASALIKDASAPELFREWLQTDSPFRKSALHFLTAIPDPKINELLRKLAHSSVSEKAVLQDIGDIASNRYLNKLASIQEIVAIAARPREQSFLGNIKSFFGLGDQPPILAPQIVGSVALRAFNLIAPEVSFTDRLAIVGFLDSLALNFERNSSIGIAIDQLRNMYSSN